MSKAALLLLLALAVPATGAQEKPAQGAGSGEIRRVDKEARKITIRHGPIPGLDMPAHTMVFQVKDPVMLESVKPGDKVRFEAQKVGGAFLLVTMEKE